MSQSSPCSATSKRARSVDGLDRLPFHFDAPPADHPAPPLPVQARLRDLGAGKSMIEGAVLALQDTSHAKLADLRHGEVCTYAFVGRVDQKAGTPVVLQKVLYLLHMVHDHYVAHAATRKNDGDVRESQSTGGHTKTVNGFRYHRVLRDGNVETLPLFKVHLLVDEAVTSLHGARPMTGMYMFCLVEVPQTLNFLQALQDACATTGGARGGGAGRSGGGTPPRDELRALWVDVMNHHLWFGGNKDLMMDSAFAGTFSDLFDINSKGFLPAWASPANCVRLARLHMMMEAMVYLEEALGTSARAAAQHVVVRFRNLDRGLAEGFDPNRYDQTWAGLARTSMVNFHLSLQQHVNLLAAHAAKASNASRAKDDEYGALFSAEGDPGPVFEPPFLIGLPTRLAEDDDEAQAFVTELCAAPDTARVDDVVAFFDAHPTAIEQAGFPPALLTHKVEMCMLWPRQGGACQNFRLWLQHNNDVSLPSASSLRILMATHQAGAQDSSLYASFLDNDCTLDPSLRTVEDYRLSLLEQAPTSTCMIYGRAESFYRAQMRSLAFEPRAVRRLQAWSLYLLTVAQPLARTYAAADSGRFGGRDPRINVYFRLGDQRNHREGLACLLAGTFRDGHMKMTGELGRDARWGLGRHRGLLLEALVGMNSAFAWRNTFMCLKKNNLELLFRLIVSGLSFKLSHNKCAIPQAPNHIGTTNWVLDFMGRVLVDHKDGKLQGTQVKTWGCGVDKVEAEYELAEHPKTYEASSGVDNLDEFPEMRDTRNSSELGLQKTHSVSGPHEQLRQVPERYFCTEIKSNLSANAAGRTEYGKFCDMMARQTRSGAAPSRTTCIKDALGNVVPITEYGAAYMELMLASSNQETRRDCVHTFAAVVSRCFSGAVDTVSVRQSEDSSAVDMGVSSKFTNQPVDQAVHNGSGWLFLAAMSVAQVVASQQMRGLLAVPPTIMDRAIMEALYDIVQHPAHTPYIAPESGCVSQWSREKEKVESTLPALGLLLHATQAFLRYRDNSAGLASMKFSEFVHDCTVNWLAAPVPPELFPELHTRLLNSTMDWCFWLLLGIFVDFFEVPALDLNCLEAFFDNAEHALPRADADRCNAWLRKMGTPLEVKADADPGPVRLSGRYITTPLGPDGHEDTNSLLTCNVSTTQRNEDVPELRRACDRLASRLHAKYGTRLKNSCNIHNAAALSVMLQRYMNVGMPKDRFGSLCTDGKRGWESWPALYHACGDSGPDTKVLDGYDPTVEAAVKNAPNLLYAVPALVCEQESPSLYRFGLEGRFLLWASAIFAGANPISQPTLQRVAVHWTCRAFQHRVPVTVYPYSTTFGSVPSVEQDGFTVAPLQDPTTRPRTMVRSLPRSAVEEQNARMLQAVVEGCMPEDYACIDGQERLARIVGCGQHTARDYRQMMVPELTLTALPEDRWVPLVGYRDDEAFALAAYRNSTTRLVHGMRMDAALVCGDDGSEHLPDGAAVVEDCEPGVTLGSVLGGSAWVLSPRPYFARPGIVVQHQEELGVLVPWKKTECPRGRDPEPYFNAHRMQYRLERGRGPPVFLDSDEVETGLVKVGSELLLRLDIGDVAAKLESKHRALQSADRFHAKFDRAKDTKAVLPVMLLYELPVSKEAQIGQGVWVGARARRRGIATNTYTALFLEVDVGMLCTLQHEEDAMGDVRRFELVG